MAQRRGLYGLIQFAGLLGCIGLGLTPAWGTTTPPTMGRASQAMEPFSRLDLFPNTEGQRLNTNTLRKPVARVLQLLDRAARAIVKKNGPMAKWMLQKAITIVEQGIRKGEFSGPDIEAIHDALSQLVVSGQSGSWL